MVEVAGGCGLERRAYLCVTEHLRGVTPDKADCLDLDERRQPREVPENYEDFASQPGLPPSLEVPTDPPRGSVEPSRGDVDIGMKAVEQITFLEEVRETESSTESRGQSISWRRQEKNLGHPNRTESPCEETAGSPQFKRSNGRKLRRTKQNKSVPRTCS